MAVKAKSGAEAKPKKKAKEKTFKSLERFCSVKSNLALTVSSYLAMIKTEMGWEWEWAELSRTEGR